MDAIDVLQAEVLKTLASPRRLQIVHLLADGPRDVGRLAEELGISQPNASQHLAVMRSAGIVESERVGRGVVYRQRDRAKMMALLKASLRQHVRLARKYNHMRKVYRKALPVLSSPQKWETVLLDESSAHV